MVKQRTGYDPRRLALSGTYVTSGTFLFVTVLIYFFAHANAALVHLYYIPLLAGAYSFGLRGGAIIGGLAAFVTGPLYPFIVAEAPLRSPAEVYVFMVMFLTVGVTVGALADAKRRRTSQIQELIQQTVRGFLHAMNAMDGQTARHSEKVAHYAAAIARQMGLPDDQADVVYSAALVHDVGKLAIPKEVLNKPGPLNSEEWEIVKQHPVESERIVAAVAHLNALLPAVRHHHERIDGRGYPDGKRGENVPLEARIIAVADAFDAMTSRRPYRAPLTTEAAFQQLRENAGSQFDPGVVEAFIAAYESNNIHNGVM